MAKNKSTSEPAGKVWGLARIAMGFVFLWAFFDKLLGLGFSTCREASSGAVNVLCERAWLTGGSPTNGFLKFGTSGPLADFYQELAGNPLVDWLFMLGLLGIGLALILGICMRLAVVSGVLLLLMMYAAALPPANNPLVDDHIIYALLLIGLLKVNVAQRFGLGRWWSLRASVKRWPVIR